MAYRLSIETILQDYPPSPLDTVTLASFKALFSWNRGLAER